MMAAFQDVDFVTWFHEPTPCKILSKIKPNVHVKGGDYKRKDLPETKIVEQNGGIMKIVRIKKGQSIELMPR